MPEVIAGFEVYFTESLGNGASGSVYQAKNLETGELVAAKQVRMKTGTDRHRIMLEIENMKSMSHISHITHTNLVRYLNHHDNQRGTVWMFLELCDLGDLDDYFVKKNPDRHEYLRLMQQMATGMAFLHSKGIVHRDIKPGNILIKSDVEGGLPIAKIGDFGFARMVDFHNSTKCSFSTMNVGTRVYMAPELFSIFGEIRCNESVDIFALGITFFSIICFNNGWERLIPSEDPTSCPESGYGYEMRNFQSRGAEDKAMHYHEEIVPIGGDDTEQKIRELIREMIQFDSEKRVKAPDVLNSINDIIMIQKTAPLKLDALKKDDVIIGPVEKETDNSGREPPESLQKSSASGDSAFSDSQKSSETPPVTPQVRPWHLKDLPIDSSPDMIQLHSRGEHNAISELLPITGQYSLEFEKERLLKVEENAVIWGKEFIISVGSRKILFKLGVEKWLVNRDHWVGGVIMNMSPLVSDCLILLTCELHGGNFKGCKICYLRSYWWCGAPVSRLRDLPDRFKVNFTLHSLLISSSDSPHQRPLNSKSRPKGQEKVYRRTVNWTLNDWRTLMNCSRGDTIHSELFGDKDKQIIMCVLLCPNGNVYDQEGTLSASLNMIHLPQGSRKHGIQMKSKITVNGISHGESSHKYREGDTKGNKLGSHLDFSTRDLNIVVNLAYKI